MSLPHIIFVNRLEIGVSYAMIFRLFWKLQPFTCTIQFVLQLVLFEGFPFLHLSLVVFFSLLANGMGKV